MSANDSRASEVAQGDSGESVARTRYTLLTDPKGKRVKRAKSSPALCPHRQSGPFYAFPLADILIHS